MSVVPLLLIRESVASELSYGARSAPDRSAAAGAASDGAAAGRVTAEEAAAEGRIDSPPFGASHASAAPGVEAPSDAPVAETRSNALSADALSNAPDSYDPHRPPSDDDDTLFELEEEIATLSAHIAAATHELLSMIAEFDRRGGWKIGGHRSCAHWLHFRTGVDIGTAREKVRTARALQALPKTSEEMAKGALSFSQARALTRTATPESEEELLEAARSLTVSELERFLRSWRVLSRKDEAEVERERYRSRTLSVFPDEMGMYEVRGKLPAEVGAVLMRAIEAAGDALFTKESASETTAKQRRADAIGLVAERALAAGFGGGGSGSVSRCGLGGVSKNGFGSVSGNVPRSASGYVSANVSGNVSAETSRADLMEETREHASRHVSAETSDRGGPRDAGATPMPGAGRMDARAGGLKEAEHSEAASQESESVSGETSESLDETSECPSCAHGQGTEAAPISGSRAERYQVVLHVEAAALKEEAEGASFAAPRSHFEDGTRASSETSDGGRRDPPR